MHCLDIGSYLVFFETLAALEFGLKVALVAEFCDDVAVAVAGEDLMALEDVGVTDLLEYFYF